MLSSHTSITAARETVFSDLGGEVAILDLRSGEYYGLNSVGALVWQILQAPRTLAELCREVEAAFEVDTERCMRDMVVLVGELRDRGLVEFSEAP
ncbi:MAG TPA: PqqD family protein [Candidatus Kapabacteria bacterium]|jgi:hypothetical protein|nr:PqqD family protein [Candidatus Kapabacteria bacterium]